ncbi:unnamed protein product [Paramecium octaurelia]|uniref:Transmembrane protein n=1 Tax=Paramecium octaurelia TaxID=43137 RepID=A0A8S1UQT1_PAROT|nr:unnamed protein product [Paramecium octaurelia]
MKILESRCQFQDGSISWFGIRDFSLFIDNIIEEYQCKDFNIQPFDGSFSNLYDCNFGYNNCVKGICINCLDGWYLDTQDICISVVIKNQCQMKFVMMITLFHMIIVIIASFLVHKIAFFVFLVFAKNVKKILFSYRRQVMVKTLLNKQKLIFFNNWDVFPDFLIIQDYQQDSLTECNKGSKFSPSKRQCVEICNCQDLVSLQNNDCYNFVQNCQLECLMLVLRDGSWLIINASKFAETIKSHYILMNSVMMEINLLMMDAMNVNFNADYFVNFAIRNQIVSYVNQISNWYIMHVNQYAVIKQSQMDQRNVMMEMILNMMVVMNVNFNVDLAVKFVNLANANEEIEPEQSECKNDCLVCDGDLCLEYQPDEILEIISFSSVEMELQPKTKNVMMEIGSIRMDVRINVKQKRIGIVQKPFHFQVNVSQWLKFRLQLFSIKFIKKPSAVEFYPAQINPMYFKYTALTTRSN